MKVIIPAKSTSTRVPSKNWREFYKGKNLVEIKIEQVLEAVGPQDVFLSCDSKELKKYADKYGINFILRDPKYASDSTPWPDAFKGMVEESPIGMEEDIAWVEVINPLFSDYKELFESWNKAKKDHDSLVLVAEMTKFLLNSKGQPQNFMFGKWHAMSQNLEPLYSWDSVCVMKKKDMLYFSYPMGRAPFLFKTEAPCIDIDTIGDFNLAQLLYSKKVSENENQI